MAASSAVAPGLVARQWLDRHLSVTARNVSNWTECLPMMQSGFTLGAAVNRPPPLPL